MKRISRTIFSLMCGACAVGLLLSCSGGGNASFSIFGGGPVTLASIEVTPANAGIAKGTTKQFTAMGIYSDGSKQDITASVTWSSSDTAVAAITAGGLATSVAVGSTTVTATLGGISGGTTLTVTAATLTQIQVTPTTPSIAKGTAKQFIATGIYSDGSNQDISATVTWSSSDTTIATVNASGLATGAGVGSATITAISGSITASTTLTVTAATLVSIAVTPTNPSIALGTTQQFTAIGTYTDNSTQNLTASVTWSSSGASVAGISATGLATSLSVNSTTITASLGGVSNSTILTITAATLVSISVSPINPSIALNTTKQFGAVGIFSDNSRQDITGSATWSAAPGGIAAISNAPGASGLATAIGAGQTTITATYGGKSANTTLTVRSATLVSIQVAPTNPSIALNTTKQLTATGLFSDSSSQDLTTSVTWTSSNIGIATVSNVAGFNGLATAVTTTGGSAVISATSGTFTGSTMLTVRSATLVSLQIAPTNPSIALGTSQQFAATGVFSDNSTQDMTSAVTWNSTVTGIATISNAAGSNGLATSVAAGTTIISAASGTFSSNNSTLKVNSVTLASIQVSPTSPNIALGTAKQFTAIGVYSDNSTQDLTASVTWSSSAPAVAAISNSAGSNGLASSAGTGQATITASLFTSSSGMISGSTNLTVSGATLISIAVSPTKPAIALGTTRQFTAIGVYSNSTTQDLTSSVTWTSTSPGVATIDNSAGFNGTASSISAGSTVIWAVYGSASGSTTLTVSPATLQSLQVAPTNPAIALGTTKQFTATGVYSDNSSQDLTASVTWSSSDVSTATIDNAAGANGLATSVLNGTTIITATSGTFSGSTTLKVTTATLSAIQVLPTNPSAALGMTKQFTAIGVYSDNSTQDLTGTASWNSSNSGIATISNTSGSAGLATPLLAGNTVTITATFGGRSGSTTLTVTSATLQSIQVTPTDPTIVVGSAMQFSAMGAYSDNTTADLTTFVAWSSSNPGIAAVSNTAGSNGRATGVSAGGPITVTASVGGVSGNTSLTVSPATLVAIQVTPTDPSIAKGTTKQFIATGVYTDNSIQDLTSAVTWTSTAPTVATVDNAAGSNGLATSVNAGSTAIWASYGNVSGSTTLVVTSATLQSIQVTPADPTEALGLPVQFTAIGVYSDNSTQDLTAAVTWYSSNTMVAAISNAPGANGLAKTTLTGSSTIMALFNGVSGNTLLTVSGAVLQVIDVQQALPTIAAGTTDQFTATGTYSDNTTVDLTALVLWSSSSPLVATISNAPGSEGLATALVGPATTTITATYAGISGNTLLTVSNATLQTVDVSPTDPIVSYQTPQQFTAAGNYSDGSVQDISALVTWSSANTAAATISNAAGFNGLATPVTGGSGTATTMISALLSGITGTSLMTVTPATISSIAVAPTNTSIAAGTKIQYTAIGTFSNGMTQDVTADVTWTSSNTTLVAISNTPGSNGLATSLGGSGTVTITAALGPSLTGSTTLTVKPVTLSSVTISNATGTTTIGLGSTVQFTASATFSDGSTQDVTSQVAWRSSNKATATISNTGGTKGLLTPIANGSTTISAGLTLGGVTRTGSQAITVSSSVTLTGITVTPAGIHLSAGSTQQYTATGTYSNGTTQDLTKNSSLTWSSTNTAVATITNKPAKNKGLAKAVGNGSTTIKAVMSGVNGTTTLNVP